MLSKLRSQMTYANVMATIAVFIALGGSSYAALHVGSTQIVDNSIRSKDIRDNGLRGRDVRTGTIRSSDVRDDSLTGGDVLESSLGTVPSASNVDANGVNSTAIQDGAVRAPELGPITEVSAISTPVADMGFRGAAVSCPAGTRVISGGAAPGRNGMHLTVSQRNGNGWAAEIHNESGDTGTFTVRAYCLE
jgi:hypothetical protein